MIARFVAAWQRGWHRVFRVPSADFLPTIWSHHVTDAIRSADLVWDALVDHEDAADVAFLCEDVAELQRDQRDEFGPAALWSEAMPGVTMADLVRLFNAPVWRVPGELNPEPTGYKAVALPD